MESKELRINIPEGYEIDKENSTFECIKFKKKLLTYENLMKELFFHKESFSVDSVDIYHISDTICYQDKLIAKTTKQLEKLLAINKLMNVAKYLNNNQILNWENSTERKWFIYIDCMHNNILGIDFTYVTHSEIVYFKTKQLALQAINILGEDTIRLALSTDW